MNEGTNNIRLNEQYETLKEMLAKNTSTTEKTLWIISDPDTGLIKRVGDIAQITSDTVKDQLVLTMQVNALTKNVELIQQRQTNVMALQGKHDIAINDLLNCAEKAQSAKKPMIQLLYNLLQAIIWSILSGAVVWLWAIRSLPKGGS